ncbi:MAG: type IV pilus assembly protein PilV [Gallionellaceae bacterium]|nr:MAG: type IV pilus assembly protein PilV [Gallionellaceae bacterium]
MLNNLHSKQRQDGFSMIEILITLVIIATALLGTAGLQLYAMKVGQSGQFRTQAVFLASDIAERIEANKLGAVAGNYVVAAASAASSAGTDCSLNPCAPAVLAAWDISQWEGAITALLPQPNWVITQTASGNPSTYQIVINWTDRSTSKVSRGETFTYTSSRTVGN